MTRANFVALLLAVVLHGAPSAPQERREPPPASAPAPSDSTPPISTLEVDVLDDGTCLTCGERTAWMPTEDVCLRCALAEPPKRRPEGGGRFSGNPYWSGADVPPRVTDINRGG